MSLVYRQSASITVQGPSISEFRKDLKQSKPATWQPTVFAAARCLALVFHDFNTVLAEIVGRQIHQGRQDALRDARDLVKLGKYLLRVPLQAAADLIGLRRREEQAKNPQPAPPEERRFDADLSYIGSILLRVQLRLDPRSTYSAVLKGDQAFQTQIDQGRSIPDIPAIGAVELLARLVGSISDNLDVFEFRMQRLELCRDFRNSPPGSLEARGIPTTVFACAGAVEV